MTSRELLYIKTIADEKSITRAAQKLYLTQPSLSHCVTTIEKQRRYHYNGTILSAYDKSEV